MARDMSNICGYISHSNVIDCINAHSVACPSISSSASGAIGIDDLQQPRPAAQRHDEYKVHHTRNILSCSTSNTDCALYECCCREAAVCRSAESPAESRVRLSRPCRRNYNAQIHQEQLSTSQWVGLATSVITLVTRMDGLWYGI
jgi:hypothetical protein